MIRCKIELVPFGDESKVETIGSIEIVNDGTGNNLLGNYRVAIQATGKERCHFGRFNKFHRLTSSVYELVYYALRSVGIGHTEPPHEVSRFDSCEEYF